MLTINIDETDEKISRKLVDSIDAILFDIDGVLLMNHQIIPGSIEFVDKLRKLGKKLAFVTNNAINSPQKILKFLEPFNAQLEEIYNPTSSFIDLLKKNGFNKDIFAIASDGAIEVMRNAGLNVIDYESIQQERLTDVLSVRELSLKGLDRGKNVGIVYVDTNFNTCYGSLQVGQVLLNRIEKVQFFAACPDDTGSIGDNLFLTGPKYNIDALERWSNRKASVIGKPEKALGNIIQSKLKISDSQRILMIGDSIASDMAFAVNSGFKSCLVLSGIFTKGQWDDWKEPENLKPNYIATSLGAIYEKIQDV
ncbi:phosphoglycolate phosphatase 2-like [Dendroctonus ponderosae]|uniref:4-nitrophenylphosphatase n=1 Tax=Dendroctonus ponderosae TaxID=77166 RepID=U4U9J2_DENPD|nr:phosphoglycolate phosphatase 2-like [Dendroctonus ponderosae]XP_048524752.1 phosphoglycolate phosphatase 2-like [Dendroctonus ponderosae]XP_048526678.1 phosphoglycolate phosphatase 2-like [Dendroctonus ponderosae]XP_048526680.1 phosphoglycolate phosphatase 2-like [Dendroctonus ponderosae]ERL83933.1 hypothetical protein D910_01226 [Dendroctonus ponderosae]ERL86605.1 hypothetical protein D910_04012 [Dendroctonus ponderosae]